VIAFFLASIALCAKASKLPAGWREVFNEWDQGISADFSGAGVVRKGKRRFSGFHQSSKKIRAEKKSRSRPYTHSGYGIKDWRQMPVLDLLRAIYENRNCVRTSTMLVRFRAEVRAAAARIPGVLFCAVAAGPEFSLSSLAPSTSSSLFTVRNLFE